MKAKTLVLITTLSLIALPLAAVTGPPGAPQGDARYAIGSPAAQSIAAFDRGTGPQDGTGTKARKGQQQGGSGQGSGDRVRKGDGSCGDQGAQQTRKGNRNGGGKGKSGQ